MIFLKKPLIVLTGPTAVGKTSLSIALAKAADGEIISADSMQVYKHMDIGSAKITKEEMEGVPHYLIDVLEPSEEFHVVRFQEMAKEAMEKIYSKGKIPILTGGTGFYIQAVVKDIDFSQDTEKSSVRTELEKLAGEKGGEYLHQLLAQKDPELKNFNIVTGTVLGRAFKQQKTEMYIRLRLREKVLLKEHLTSKQWIMRWKQVHLKITKVVLLEPI